MSLNFYKNLLHSTSNLFYPKPLQRNISSRNNKSFVDVNMELRMINNKEFFYFVPKRLSFNDCVTVKPVSPILHFYTPEEIENLMDFWCDVFRG